MIIVYQNREGFVNIDTINEVTVENNRIIARYGNNTSILGEYNSNIKAEQLVRDMVNAMRQGKAVFELPQTRN